MFNKLVASEGRKNKAISPTTIIASVAAHVLLLGGAVYASEHTEVGRKVKEEVVAYMEIEPEQPKAPEPPKAEEPPPPPPPEPETAPPPVAKGFQELVPPTEPPPKIPDVDLNQKAVNVEDFSGVGVSGGTSKGIEGGTAQNMANKKEDNTGTVPIDVNLAEEKPELRNRAEVARLLQRLYPPLLRDAGITGQATIKFVVNAQGRVDPGSISVVSSTHDAFGEASTKVGEKMSFKPAKVGGRAVPVLVTMPVSWTLER
ncbi:MAG TPA: energy transducer TonB [Longimicrobiaceae bacterium]|nr:energy transducer TonB [Longimicrobiaceae bacterium]